MDKHSTMAAMSQARRYTERLAEVYTTAGDRSGGDRLHNCSRYLETKWCPHCKHLVTMVGNTCKMRLCPICSVRRSRKIAAQAIGAYEHMQSKGVLTDCNGLLVTLTQPNCAAGNLAESIDALIAAQTSLLAVRAIRRSMKAMARNVEVTYNPDTDTWHPHVHMIVWAHNADYATLSSWKWWRQAWQKVMRLSTEPICDVRPLHTETDAVYEVSKYVSKMQSLLDNIPSDLACERIFELHKAIDRRRILTYTGEWRIARKELNQGTEEPDITTDDDNEHPHGTCPKCATGMLHEVFIWTGCTYEPMTSSGDEGNR